MLEMLGSYVDIRGNSLVTGIGKSEGLYRFETRDQDGWCTVHGDATPYKKVAVRWYKKFIAGVVGSCKSGVGVDNA